MESEVETHTEASSDRLRALLAKIEKDPSLLDEPDTEATICRELGKLITQHMPIAEDLDDEQTSRLTIDSLMAIEMRGWARRNLGLELSLAAITKAGTIGKLGTVVIEQLRAKYCVG
jgi:acyl carrier protein